MTQGERVKEVRKALGLTLDKFGEKVGVKKQTVSRIENGVNNVTDQMVLSICREFNVNYDFLMNGEGEMFDDLPQTVLDELCAQYDLDDLDRTLVEMYIEMPEQVRDYLKQEIRKRFLKEDTKK
ncbi:XRE family transcriptional regulator [Blautia obeum]|jgi:transcriptional regulator with XRE-family HTH domain|uniref:XRE family transcriptional regulator n=1 Tax=Blautia obeum TaxID=40520 RepID=A0A412EM95_9FIRM|nr:helix-turn-helix transcriptional regulator [Blautia obeum]RGR45805.1 XRE family transcriptional regulator [Blautia obeum]DAI77300.1 MAG TPA: helix-turn-helix domain protein [Caudoviricetes sp.]